ncbi:TonB-dependent receptor domain-containing protein [Paracoccus sp. p4-l81]|uniref:TonB-dependent receptor domain-containing protein n=1 Tax=Paracoccus sp. p4-l81 TaxID=3342806 RepID=UPI0035B747DD
MTFRIGRHMDLLITVAALALLAQGAAAQHVSVALDPITLKGVNDNIDADTLMARDAADLHKALRGQAGVYTRSALDNPGVTVNIRGLQGLGRVNASIDGVPQTARNLSGHAGSLDTLVFVDPGLLSGVAITKGAVAGAAGGGTLAGAADFRTLQFSDVLREGRNQGGLLRFGAGSNGKDWSATLAGAARHQTATGGSLSVLGAVSGFQERPYKDGNGVTTTTTDGQSPTSWLVKGEAEDGAYGKLSLLGMGYRNSFSAPISSGYVWDVDQKTAALRYERGGLTANLWWTENEIFFPTNSRGTGGIYQGRRGTDTGKGFDVTNRSDVTLGATPVALSYGLAWSRNSYDGNEKSGANGDGSLTKAGAFIGATADLGPWDLTGELRYDRWETEGVTDYRADGSPVATARRSGGKVNASLRADYAINDATGVFAALSTTMRPPTASEMFYPGAVFAHSDTTSTAINNNPNLRPEQAVNAEIGVTHADGPLSLNATLFHNRIKDYISYSSDPADGRLRWVNLDGTSTMKGLELETRYDTGRFFAGLALTVADTEKPKTAAPGMIATSGTLPDDYATLDLGGRWLDGTLTAGARLRYTGKAETYAGSPVPVAIKSNTLIDLYADWQVNDALHVYANVENLTDRQYQTANAAFTEATGSLGGRGRTISIGGALKF